MTWIADKAVTKSDWRTSTGRGMRKKAKRAIPKLAGPLTQGNFPTHPVDAKKQIGKRFPKGELFSDAEWNAFKELSSTPEGQTWLNASGMLTHDQIEQYLSNDNAEKFRGFHLLHKPSKVVLASYVSRQTQGGEDGKRFEGTPPLAVALSMEARHTTNPARRDELKKQIDQLIANEWAKTLEYTEPNDDADTAMNHGAVLAPKTLKDSLTFTEPRPLSRDEALERHRQSIEVLKNIFHVLQAGAEIYDAGSKTHVPLEGVPVAKLLSHGGRVNIRVPQSKLPYALTEFLGITDSNGKPKAGVFKRDFGTHHMSLRKGKFKEQGGQYAAIRSKLDDTELYGINLAIGGFGLKDFNGDIILNDGAHGHIFIGYRPPRPDRHGALQIGIETTGPGAPSTVGYVHNWRSTEKTANPISSVGGLKQDKIGDEKGKNARTVDLRKFGDDWKGPLEDRADQFAHDVKENPTEAIKNLVGPREIPPQDTLDTAPLAADEPSDESSDGSPDGSSDESDDASDRSERGSRRGDRRDPPGDTASDPKRGAKDPGQGSDQRTRGAEQAPKGNEPSETLGEAPQQMTARTPEASSPRPEAGTTQSAPGKAPERPGQPRPETTAQRSATPVTAITTGMQAPVGPPAPTRPGWLGKKLGTGGHGFAGMVSNKGAADREQALADQYELQIGPDDDGADDTHFSHKMLDHIEKALGDLPPEHITGSPTLRAIIRDISSEEAASAYDELTDTINIVNPPKVPTFIYSRLNRRWNIQRKQMDRGALGDYKGVDKEQDRALGITEKRHVMGGVSDVLANGSLVKWTMRHEVAHSIDKLVDWRSLAGEDRFGGWRVHSDTRDFEDVTRAIFEKAGITDDEANNETGGVSLIQTFASFLHAPSRRADMKPLEEFPADAASGNPALKDKLEKAVRTVKIAMAQPWTLDDGGASELEVDGRIYHVDQYNNWVSYRQDARNNAVSNYQFSTPAEWFAETYASYYDPNPAPKARLTQAVRDFFENELANLVDQGRDRWERINENTRNAELGTGTQPPQPPAGSSANPGAASSSAVTAGFSPDITPGDRPSGSRSASPPRDANGDPQQSPPREATRAPQDGAPQETGGTHESLGNTQAALQALIDASKTWSHRATPANRREAKNLLGDILRSQGVDRSLVDRLAELIDDPDSLSQHEFAICALQSVLRTQLTSDLSGFARVVAAEFTGKLFDRDGKQIADFSLDNQGEHRATTSPQAIDDPIQSVIRGELPLKDAPIGNKLLQNGVKKAGARRADLENKGRAWSDKHVLDYLLARGLGKMLSKLAPEQYKADAEYTTGVVPGYLDKTTPRAKGATGPSKKHGDLLLSANSLVTLFTDILGGDAQTMIAGDNHDVDRINDVLARPEQAPFALATFLDGKGLVERAAEFAKNPTTARPFDTAATSDTSSAHQVVINGKITEDGEHYVVPLHTWQQSFSIKVKKDLLPSLFPVFTYGTYLPSQAPAANDPARSQPPKDNALTQLTTGGDDALGTGGRGLGGLFANKGAAEREQALADQYALQVGPDDGTGGKHFSHKMLDRIEKVLGELPPDHVTGNPTLRGIIRDISSERSASEYDELTDTINIVNPKLKNIEVPSWLYSRLNRGVSWQRYLMDRGAKADYDGISKEQDKALGITGRRKVMGGVSDVLAHGNLVKWTMRHEVAHSIDKLVDWRSLAGEDRFGGWRVHSDTRDFEDVARAILAKAGITGDEANRETDGVSLIQTFASFLHAPSRREDMTPLEEFPADAASENPDLKDKLEKAVRAVKIAMAQPWTLVDGGASELEVDGRIYHVDQYDNWVSYRQDARNNAVSNYQFSTPAEWFAETYASYYDPDPAPKARLTQAVRDFFENELPDLVTSGRERWQRINENTRNAEQSAGTQPPTGSAASAITSGYNPAASNDPGQHGETSRDDAPRVSPQEAPAERLAGHDPASDSRGETADPQAQADEIQEEPEPPSERAPDPATSTPVEEVTWIVDKAVKNTIWRTDTGPLSRDRAKHGLFAIQGPLSASGFPPDPTTAKERLDGRFPRGPLLSDAEWSAFEQLSSTPQGQSWLNASGMLTHEQVEKYLSDDRSINPEQFRGFHKLHNASKVILASYVSRQMKGGEAGKRFEGTPPAALALSMEARHTTDPARRDELKRLIDQGIVEEWSKTLEYTEPNDAATTAINKGAVLAPKTLLNSLTFTEGKKLSKDEVVKRHGQSLTVLKNIFHLLQAGAEIYDGAAKSHVPLQDVPVAKLLSHGGRVNVQIPAGTAPYALTEHLGITDSKGNPMPGVFKRLVGTHHVSFADGKFKEQGGQLAALKTKFDDTELYGINLAVGGLGLKDFNGDVILPDGAHGHMFIGYRPPKPGRPGALQIGMETTGPGAPSTVGYVHNWRSTEKTANPISSVGGLKQDKIGDESTKNARTVDLGKLGSDWAKTLKDRADRFEQELKQRGKDALTELLGPRTQPPQELQDKTSGFFATAPQTGAPASGTPGDSGQRVHDQLSDFINGQPEIRAYIPHAPGFGHQSSTVNLIRRIADQFKYPGTVRVIYEDAGTGETLKQRAAVQQKQARGEPLDKTERSVLGDKTIEEKLAILVPGFDASPGAGEQTVTIGTTQVVFTPESQAKQLPPARFGFGFTGGYDPGDNLAERLSSDRVLRLQPYGWKLPRGIWTALSDEDRGRLAEIESKLNDKKTLPSQKSKLRTARTALLKELREKHFKPMPSLDGKAHTWAVADEETFENALPELGAKAELVKHIMSEIDRDKPVISLYGLGHPEKAQSSPASHELFNVIAGVARAQQQSPDKFPEGAALVVTANLDEPHYQDLDALIHDPLGEGRRVLTDSKGGDRWDDGKVGAFAGVVKELGLEERFRRITVDDTEESVKGAIEAMSGMGKDQILLLQLGGSPPAVFEVLFSHTNMMGVLEGPNTANVMMSQGKPFVKGGGGATREQVSAPELADKGAFADERALIDNVSETLSGNLSSWLPGGASPGLQRKDADIADYLVSLRDEDSPLRQYHERVRDEYTSPERDAFAEGMLELIKDVRASAPSGSEAPGGPATMWGAPLAAGSTGARDPAPSAESAPPRADGSVVAQTTPDDPAAQGSQAPAGSPAPSLAELTDKGMKRGLRGSALDDYTRHALATGDPDPNSYLTSLVDDIEGMPSGFKERAKELIEHPERIEQQDFAFCGLTAIAEAALHNNPMKAIDVFRSLFDATPFPLESGGAIGVTPSPEEVARGKDPKRNVLLGGRVKQIESMSRHTGKDYGDKRLDIMLARALPKLWKSRSNDKYEAWREDVERKFDKGFAQGRDQLQGGGARLKRGDFPMSEEAYTGILEDVFDASAVNVMSAPKGGYDIDAINALLNDDASAPFVHGIVLAGPVNAAANGGTWDPSRGDGGLHQVRIAGPIETIRTPDGADGYVVPLSTYGKVIRLPVPRDRMGEYFPHILTGNWHRPQTSPAVESPSQVAPTSQDPTVGKSGFMVAAPASDGTTSEEGQHAPASSREQRQAAAPQPSPLVLALKGKDIPRAMQLAQQLLAATGNGTAELAPDAQTQLAHGFFVGPMPAPGPSAPPGYGALFEQVKNLSHELVQSGLGDERTRRTLSSVEMELLQHAEQSDLAPAEIKARAMGALSTATPVQSAEAEDDQPISTRQAFIDEFIDGTQQARLQDDGMTSRVADAAQSGPVRISDSGVRPVRAGKLPLENYTLQKIIGKGISGNVALAEHQSQGETKKVVVKKIKLEAGKEREQLDNILRESAIQMYLMDQGDEPVVVKLQKALVAKDSIYIVLEPAEGSLESHLQKNPPSRTQLISIFHDLAGSYAVMHKAGILHKDIKADNVLVKDGKYPISDFGLSKRIDGVQQRIIEDTKRFGQMILEHTEALARGQLSARDLKTLDSLKSDMGFFSPTKVAAYEKPEDPSTVDQLVDIVRQLYSDGPAAPKDAGFMDVIQDQLWDVRTRSLMDELSDAAPTRNWFTTAPAATGETRAETSAVSHDATDESAQQGEALALSASEGGQQDRASSGEQPAASQPSPLVLALKGRDIPRAMDLAQQLLASEEDGTAEQASAAQTQLAHGFFVGPMPTPGPSAPPGYDALFEQVKTLSYELVQSGLGDERAQRALSSVEMELLQHAEQSDLAPAEIKARAMGALSAATPVQSADAAAEDDEPISTRQAFIDEFIDGTQQARLQEGGMTSRVADAAQSGPVRISDGGVRPVKAGKLPLENYTLQKIIGKGVSGNVALAEHQSQGETKKVVVKKIRLEPGKEREQVDNILRESAIQMYLMDRGDEPVVVKLQKALVAKDSIYIVLEPADGSLESHLQKDPPSRTQLISIFHDLAGSYAEMHKAGILHKDIKADNVLVKDGKYLISDFGLSKRIDGVQQRINEDAKRFGLMILEHTEALARGQLSARDPKAREFSARDLKTLESLKSDMGFFSPTKIAAYTMPRNPSTVDRFVDIVRQLYSDDPAAPKDARFMDLIQDQLWDVRTRSLMDELSDVAPTRSWFTGKQARATTSAETGDNPGSVYALGSDKAVLDNARNLAGKEGHRPVSSDQLDELGASDKLTIVAHGSTGRFGGMTPAELAAHLKENGAKALGTLSLKGCESADFARELMGELQKQGIFVERITGRNDLVTITKDGRTLVKDGSQWVHQAPGTKVEVRSGENDTVSVKDAYAHHDDASAVEARSRALREGINAGALPALPQPHGDQQQPAAPPPSPLVVALKGKDIPRAMQLAQQLLASAGDGTAELAPEAQIQLAHGFFVGPMPTPGPSAPRGYDALFEQVKDLSYQLVQSGLGDERTQRALSPVEMELLQHAEQSDLAPAEIKARAMGALSTATPVHSAEAEDDEPISTRQAFIDEFIDGTQQARLQDGGITSQVADAAQSGPVRISDSGVRPVKAGKLPLENYTLQKIIGKGISGNVALAEHQSQGQTQKVVVKKIKLEPGKEREQVDNILRESAIQMYLMDRDSEPVVVKLQKALVAKDSIYIVLEPADGSLESHLQKDPPSRTQLISIFHDLAGSYAEMHKAGILHKDIKADNVLVKDKKYLISDFGLSKRIDGDGQRIDEDTRRFGQMILEHTEALARGQLSARDLKTLESLKSDMGFFSLTKIDAYTMPRDPSTVDQLVDIVRQLYSKDPAAPKDAGFMKRIQDQLWDVRTRSLLDELSDAAPTRSWFTGKQARATTSAETGDTPGGVYALGSDKAVLDNARNLAGKEGHRPVSSDQLGELGASDKLTIVAHGSTGRFGGMTPAELAAHLKENGAKALGTLSLKGCESADFARELMGELQKKGIFVERITGRNDLVTITKDGRTLVKDGSQWVHQAPGTKVEVRSGENDTVSVKDAYAHHDDASAIEARSRALREGINAGSLPDSPLEGGQHAPASSGEQPAASQPSPLVLALKGRDIPRAMELAQQLLASTEDGTAEQASAAQTALAHGFFVGPMPTPGPSAPRGYDALFEQVKNLSYELVESGLGDERTLSALSPMQVELLQHAEQSDRAPAAIKARAMGALSAATPMQSADAAAEDDEPISTRQAFIDEFIDGTQQDRLQEGGITSRVADAAQSGPVRISDGGVRPVKAGKLPLENYTLQKVIGKGISGNVALAEHQSQGQTQKVVVKKIKLEPGKEREQLDNILRESAIQMYLMDQDSEPVVVKLQKALVARDSIYIVLDPAEGSLESHLQKNPPSRTQLISIFHDLAGSYAEMHRAGILHKDIKADNVLVKDGKYLVSDFGLSKRIDGAQQRINEDAKRFGLMILEHTEALAGDQLSARDRKTLESLKNDLGIVSLTKIAAYEMPRDPSTVEKLVDIVRQLYSDGARDADFMNQIQGQLWELRTRSLMDEVSDAAPTRSWFATTPAQATTPVATRETPREAPAAQPTDAPAALDGDVPIPPPIDALVRTLVEKSGAWSSPRTQADKREAIALVTELLQQLGMDAKVVDRGEQGKDGPDDEHSACTCVR
ncbi:protein kinase [Sorangium sp. So ce119]|uniref:protein kinase domain-containing protein n=1 Tax=Sorangium sp. So ce119 TaxID=3133279 RepID=UPI003F63B675